MLDHEARRGFKDKRLDMLLLCDLSTQIYCLKLATPVQYPRILCFAFIFPKTVITTIAIIIVHSIHTYAHIHIHYIYIYMRERESIDTRINSAFLLDILGIFGLPQKAPFLSHPIKHTKAHCRGPPPEAPTFSLREHGGVASPGSFPVAPKFYPGNLEMGLSITGVPQ